MIPEICKSHKPKKLTYIQWIEWSDKKIKRGAKQKQCHKCKRWLFKEEY